MAKGQEGQMRIRNWTNSQRSGKKIQVSASFRVQGLKGFAASNLDSFDDGVLRGRSYRQPSSTAFVRSFRTLFADGQRPEERNGVRRKVDAKDVQSKFRTIQLELAPKASRLQRCLTSLLVPGGV